MSAYPNQITVYKYTRTDDGFGGYVPAVPTLQADAPRWANIEPASGDDFVLNERFTTLKLFDIEVNWRNDFTWLRDMFIVSAEHGVIDVEGIKEIVRKRKIELRGVYVEGVDDTGSGTPTPSQGALAVLYYIVPDDATTITLPALDGKTLYLFFRDGIEKTIVASNPQINEVMHNGEGVFSLVASDIWYAGERITVLYI